MQSRMGNAAWLFILQLLTDISWYIFKYLISYPLTSPTFRWHSEDICADRPELTVSWEVHSPAQKAHTSRNTEKKSSVHKWEYILNATTPNGLPFDFGFEVHELGYWLTSFVSKLTFLTSQKHTWAFASPILLFYEYW